MPNEASTPPKTKKPRSKSTFLVMEEIAATPGEQPGDATGTCRKIGGANSMNAARTILDDVGINMKYVIVCVRERGETKVETVTTRKVAK